MDLHSDPRRVIAAALQRLEAGKGSTYLILGEGGVGKTHFLTGVLAEARAAGWQCLYAAAHEYDRDIAYATLRNLVGALDGGRAQPELRNATLELQRALDAVVLAGPDAMGQGLQQPPLVLVTRLLRSMAMAAPVVIVIDDAHLADEDSLVAVTLAARHLAGHRLLLVFASRTRPWHQGGGLAATLGHLVSEQDGTVLELQPLQGDALDGLVETVLGASPDPRLSRYLAERTRGNALLVRETLNALQAAGAVRVERGTGYLVDDSPPLFSRREALLHKVFAGSRLDRDLARLVAVFGRVDLEYLRLLAELAGQPLDEVRKSFDSLVAGGSLSDTGSGWYEFSHPLVGELLYADVGPAERRRVHAAIAAHFAKAGNELRMPALERARHLTEGAARGEQAAITAALHAADQALGSSPLTAARWYARALNLLPETDDTVGETLSRQAVAYWKGSRPTLAIEAGRSALARLDAGRSHDRTVATMVNCFNAMGELQSAAELLVREMEHVLDPAPYQAQRAAMVARLGDTAAARLLAGDAWARVRTSTPADQVIAYAYLGQLECAVGIFGRVQEAVDRLEGLGRNELELPIGARTSAFESAAHNAAIAGDSGRAGQLLAMSADSGRLAGFKDMGGQAGLARALVEFAAGDWTAASETIAREAVHLEFSGLGSNLSRLRSLEVQILAGRGDFRRATELLAAIEPPATRRIDHAIWQAWSAAVHVAMARPEQAMPQLAILLADAEREGWNEVATIAYTALVEGHLAAGDEAAAGLAADFARHATATAMPRDLTASGLAFALTHRDVGRAQAVLADAVGHGAGYLAAQARHTLGSLGHEPAANLSAAWAAFKAMEATLWLKRVEATARVQGIALDRAGTDAAAGGPLTDVERQLIALLGDGLGNRQIADILSYSTKTIEAYLTRLYKKTGYNSRVELIVAHERGDVDLG